VDLREGITYGGSYDLNDASVSGGKIEGNQINALNISPVSVVGYTEKKAIDKGLDASDIYSAARTVRIEGQTSGASIAATYDAFQELLAALSPDESFRADEDDKGYLPLAGYIPTEDSSFPESERDPGFYLIPVVIFCRPKNPPAFDFNRDRVGGRAPKRGSSIPWDVVLEAKDPRIYINDLQSIALASTGDTGTLDNRGRFPTPLSVTLNIEANQTASAFTLTVPGTEMEIAIPHSVSTQVFWYDGYRKVLYRKIGSGAFTKAMSYLTIDNPAEALPEGGAYTWTLDNDVLAADSAIEYFEAWG
jgi:hypothetical protein